MKKRNIIITVFVLIILLIVGSLSYVYGNQDTSVKYHNLSTSLTKNTNDISIDGDSSDILITLIDNKKNSNLDISGYFNENTIKNDSYKKVEGSTMKLNFPVPRKGTFLFGTKIDNRLKITIPVDKEELNKISIQTMGGDVEVVDKTSSNVTKSNKVKFDISTDGGDVTMPIDNPLVDSVNIDSSGGDVDLMNKKNRTVSSDYDLSGGDLTGKYKESDSDNSVKLVISLDGGDLDLEK
ncbi:DUF4097 family beta strand repeat-containing protein [Companilactobacillus metriopterae]|uniref:DUF4097 family beta strand repeat-containing protein n=1 Tax=Companilactobacillus metriopterae TaxID=1909267 RepID=UPI00100A772C|nr:DUF4097 family beta strand repeat-containing protein [Companilactobacillus metriopterae]